MHLRILVLALLTAAYGFSAAVAVGKFEWVPIYNGDTPSQWSYFRVTAQSGPSNPSNDVLDEIRLENLKLVVEIQSPLDPQSFALKAFTLYPNWFVGDGTGAVEIDISEEPGNSNIAGFPTVTLDQSGNTDMPGQRGSRRFLNAIASGDGDIRITKAYLEYSGVAVNGQPTWTLNDGNNTPFTPFVGNLYRAELYNGGNLFGYSGDPFSISLTVSDTAIPEPSTVVLALGGVALMFARRRFAR